jgi:hypothetical protein
VVVTMTTEEHAWVSAQMTSTSQTHMASTVCGCGQDLDVCAGAHCPRCGTRFARPRPVLAWHPTALLVDAVDRPTLAAA